MAYPQAYLPASSPGLAFSRLLGTDGATKGLALALGVDGAVYVAGTTTSTNWLGSRWAGSTPPGQSDLFVARLSADGETIERVIRFGGSSDDKVTSILVTSNGVIVTGATRSSDFPQSLPNPRAVEREDVFVARLDLQLEALRASVVVGGDNDEEASSALIRSGGELWLAGTTDSNDFPPQGISDAPDETKDGFLIHLDPQSLEIRSSLRVRGAGQDEISAIAEDGQGRLLITGSTDSPDFPTRAPWPRQQVENLDTFLLVIDPTGPQVLQGGPLGGSRDDRGSALAVDPEDSIWIAGSTSSETFESSEHQSGYAGAGDALMIRVQISPVVSTTFRTLGGSGPDSALALVLGDTGDLWVSGQTSSAEFPTVAPIQSPPLGGSADIFIARIRANDLQPTFVSTLGSSAADTVASMIAGQDGSILLAGSTATPTRGSLFPTTPVSIPTLPPLTRMPSSQGFVTSVAVPGIVSGADNFPNPKTMLGRSWTALDDLSNATREPGEPSHAAASAEHSLWWRWVAPGTGPTVVSTVGSQVLASVAVYQGTTLTNLTTHAANAQDPVDPVSSRATFIAQAGEVYHVAVDAITANLGKIQLTLSHGVPPNDDFRYRTPLTGLPLKVMGGNEGATEEFNEPQHAETPGRQSVWWSWRAADHGHVGLSTDGSDFGPPSPNALAVAVYRGTHVTNLTAVASNNGGRKQLTAFSVIAGESYQIAVDGLQYWPYVEPGSTGAIALSFEAVNPPANDPFDNATIINPTALPFEYAGQLTACSIEPAEPRFPFTAQRSRWWRLEATQKGNIQVTARGSSQPHVGVFKGSLLPNLELVLMASPQRGEFEGTRALFRASPGIRYYIMVDGDYYSSPDDFTLRVESVVAPPNDDFADASRIEGSIARFAGTNSGASLESQEPATVYQGFSSVWWRWIAPSNGTARVRLVRSDWPGLIVLSAFAGSSLAQLQPVGGNHSQRDVRNDCYPCLSDFVSFPVLQGATYALSVSGFGSATGSFELEWELLQAPANDLLSQAQQLDGMEAWVQGTTTGATASEQEPAASTQHPGGQSVWWSWTAPSSGSLRLARVDASFPLIVSVHTRDATGRLARVTEGILATNALEVPVTDGLTYSLSIDSPGEQGPFRWHLWLRPALQMGWRTASDGQLIEINLRGTATGLIRIDTSDNLRTWIPWQTNRLVNGQLEMPFSPSLTARHRFVRALEIP